MWTTSQTPAIESASKLNRAFAYLTHNLDQLLIAQAFKDNLPDEDNPHCWQMHLDQIQMEVNRRLTQNLCNMEHGDIKRLHKIMDMDPRVRASMYGEDFDDPPRRTKPVNKRKKK